jgi:hypothetical protein
MNHDSGFKTGARFFLISSQRVCLRLMVARYTTVTARPRWPKFAFFGSFEKLRVSAICFVMFLSRRPSAPVPMKELTAKIFHSNTYRHISHLNFAFFLEFYLFHSEPQNGV